MINQLIDEILVPGVTRVYRLTNAEGKEWVMPARNMRTGMALYQPGAVNGRRLKRFFPLLHRIPGVAKAIHADTMRIDLLPELRELIAACFGVGDFEWSLFGGTPCVHQKITMQIYRGKQLLGYVKVTGTDEVGELFDHEQKALALLESAERKAGRSLRHPRILFNGWCAGVRVFIQTTEKTLSSREIHTWEKPHARFVTELADLTRRTMPFAETDFARVLADIDPYLCEIPADQAAVIRAKRAEVLALMAGKDMDVVLYHGDFTPWNMVVLPGGDLFVFDWEYSRLSYPEGLDRWHYVVQTAIFERTLTHDRIVAMLQPHFGDPTLKLYLLDVICHFTVREKGHFPRCMGRSMALWCRLLDKCQ